MQSPLQAKASATYSADFSIRDSTTNVKDRNRKCTGNSFLVHFHGIYSLRNAMTGSFLEAIFAGIRPAI